MATTVIIHTLPAVSVGRLPSSLHMTLTPAQASLLDQIRQGLIADTSVITGAGNTLSTNEDAVRFLIQIATNAT